MAVSHLATAGRTFTNDWSDGSGRSAEETQVLPGRRLGLNVGYIEWVRARIPAKQTYYVTPHRQDRARIVTGWLTFRLLPGLRVGSPRAADWLVVYRGRSDVAPAAARAFGPVLWFAPGYGIARRRHAV